MPSPEDPVSRYLAALRDELMSVEGGVGRVISQNSPRPIRVISPSRLLPPRGRAFAVGDAEVLFTIQSVSKPFAYGHAFACHGRAAVLDKVGVEPTGDPFNSIVLDDVANHPYNPMVNSGAIAVAELFPGDTLEQRVGAMRDALSRFAGRALDIDEAVFRSESQTGHRNRAIAYLMRNSDMIKREPEEVLAIYFRQCSLLVNCRDLAVMAATLANNGVNPSTGEAAMPGEFVQDVLSVVHSCGMYDYAGHWSYEVGIPTKSGVSGCVIAVVPGQIGIAAYSPPLDGYGNRSARLWPAARYRPPSAFTRFAVARAPIPFSATSSTGGTFDRSASVRPPSERFSAEATGPSASSRRKAICTLARPRDWSIASEKLPPTQPMSLSTFVTSWTLTLQRCDCCRPATGRLANLRSALASAEGAPSAVSVFDGLEAALEHLEDEILGLHKLLSSEADFSLSQIAIFQGLDAEEMRLLTQLVAPKLTTLESGQVIFRKGELGKTFFAIVRGSASVELPSIESGGKTVHIASVGKGLTFGELALIEDRPRAAQIVAESELICYAISIEALRAFGRSHPPIYVKILMNIIRNLADALQFSGETIRALGR